MKRSDVGTKQMAHNQAHGITPETIHKAVHASLEATVAEEPGAYDVSNLEEPGQGRT